MPALHVDFDPLLTFADRPSLGRTDDSADERELERVWQDAGPLVLPQKDCRRVVEAIDADLAVRELLRDFPALRDRIEELGRIASWAAERGARVRLTYTMD